MDKYEEYGYYQSVVSLFTKQAADMPDNTAVRVGEKRLSYGQMDRLSSRIASYLKQTMKLSKGAVVGVMLEREEYLLPVIFGIMRAGGVYLPIDPGFPESRISFMLQDAGADVLVSRTGFTNQLGASSFSIVDLNKDLQQILAMPNEEGVALQKCDHAYIMYTSGSTGIPKGVIISHGSLLNVVLAMDQLYPLEASDNYLFKTTVTFDVSIAEIFGWLVSGGTVTLLKAGAASEPEAIIEAIERYEVTHINFAPSVFSFFLDELSTQNMHRLRSLKYVMLAGEALAVDIVRRFQALPSAIALENIYGPTEATIYGSAYSIPKPFTGSTVPIGKAVPNATLYVVDEHGALQPPDAPGELWIGGRGVALGYNNREDLTREKFIPNPFGGGNVYRTGDLVKWSEAGDLLFIGRVDDQVKIRGVRIELGEIEFSLEKLEAIKKAVAMAVGQPGSNQLVAFYTINSAITIDELRAYLGEELPDYMVPSRLIELAEFPLLSSGKVNKVALSEQYADCGSEPQHLPETETETAVAEIWKRVLKKDSIDVEDHLTELGGHSLKATRIYSEINKQFRIDASQKTLFDFPTVRSLAGYIDTVTYMQHTSTKKSSDIQIEL